MNNKITRRDILKGLLTVPVVGALGWSYLKNKKFLIEDNAFIPENIRGLNNPIEISYGDASTGKQIRLGYIGIGGRGASLMHAIGFVHPNYVETLKNEALSNTKDKRFQDLQELENVNVVVNGVCDVFDIRAKEAAEAGANLYKNTSQGKMAPLPKQYKTYKELLASPDIDAVIIATPDHWHAPITIEAANAGKHVYCEKPLSWSISETHEVKKVVKENNIIFQLGHQGRQTDSYIKAKELIQKGILGDVSLVEVCTNRNSPNGAWVYAIHPKAGPHNIDWNQFLGQAPYHDFSLERFFRWRCWWDYGSGLSGDLFNHEFDAINQIMDVGIPYSATASGGIYFFKDGRDVPDTLQMSMEFPDKNLTLLYSATQSSQRNRGKVIMGHDANLELSRSLTVYADPGSTQYKEQIEKKLIDIKKPIYTYNPGDSQIDAITSATEKYFA
ncbi:MAG: Gfo/Idh/MocA family oxidoreductase, partial [Bacteroidales bacterium]|nr:Gfo/Idh/MocA family oxidoreductase [Bacteroidales bacterium]